MPCLVSFSDAYLLLLKPDVSISGFTSYLSTRIIVSCQSESIVSRLTKPLL
jgi:hypothetical protein